MNTLSTLFVCCGFGGGHFCVGFVCLHGCVSFVRFVMVKLYLVVVCEGWCGLRIMESQCVCMWVDFPICLNQEFQDCEFEYSGCQSEDKGSSLDRNVEETKFYSGIPIILCILVQTIALQTEVTSETFTC